MEPTHPHQFYKRHGLTQIMLGKAYVTLDGWNEEQQQYDFCVAFAVRHHDVLSYFLKVKPVIKDGQAIDYEIIEAHFPDGQSIDVARLNERNRLLKAACLSL